MFTLYSYIAVKQLAEARHPHLAGLELRWRCRVKVSTSPNDSVSVKLARCRRARQIGVQKQCSTRSGAQRQLRRLCTLWHRTVLMVPMDSKSRRSSERTNTFGILTVFSDGVAQPGRIRNLSTDGAMIETVDPLQTGAEVVLKRGEQQQAGKVTWANGNRCGVKFDHEVVVKKWLNEPRASQRDVDKLVFSVRRGVEHPAARPQTLDVPEEISKVLKGRLAQEIEYAARMLDGLSEVLIKDPIILHRHATKLQSIDIARQLLAGVATLVASEDPVTDLLNLPSSELRNRLLRKNLD